MRPTGFTLIELLVALAVMAVLAALAAPSLGDFLRDCRQTVTLNALTHAIHAARTLAGVRGQPVDVCPSHDGSVCLASTNWSGQLLLRSSVASPETLRVMPLGTGGGQQTIRANRSTLRFAPLTAAGTTATLTVCDDRGNRSAAAVIISRTGRPRIARLDAAGQPLACP